MTRVSAFSALALLVFAGCGTASEPASTDGTSAPASSNAASDSALTVEDAWIKAAPSNMTGAFATVTNEGAEEVTISGASSDVTGQVELHTTVIDPETGTSMMQEMEDGFSIEPGQSLELVPGGDHIMLMDMKCSLVAGTTSFITLHTSAGDVEFEAEVRDYAGAKEEYAPGEASSPAAETMESTGTDEHSGHGGTATEEAVLPQCA